MKKGEQKMSRTQKNVSCLGGKKTDHGYCVLKDFSLWKSYWSFHKWYVTPCNEPFLLFFLSLFSLPAAVHLCQDTLLVIFLVYSSFSSKLQFTPTSWYCMLHLFVHPVSNEPTSLLYKCHNHSSLFARLSLHTVWAHPSSSCFVICQWFGLCLLSNLFSACSFTVILQVCLYVWLSIKSCPVKSGLCPCPVSP